MALLIKNDMKKKEKKMPLIIVSKVNNKIKGKYCFKLPAKVMLYIYIYIFYKIEI